MTDPMRAYARSISPAAVFRCVRLLILVCVVVLGSKPGRAPGRIWVQPFGAGSSAPVESSEAPTDPQESSADGVFLHHAQRGEVAGCKLPRNHLTSHYSRGRSFLISESCFGSEHALRCGNCSHLRC